MTSRGFSLTELLLAILILGQIAAFSIPKVIGAQQNGQKKAIFRETMSALYEVYYNAMISGKLSDPKAYLYSNMNATRQCQTNAFTEGCFPQTGPRNTEPGLVLHSGATLAGFNNVSGLTVTNDNFTVDWNGLAGPNTVGEDQLQLTVFFPDSTNGYYCQNSTFGKPLAILPGSCSAVGGSGSSTAANTALYDSIFQ